MKKIEEKYTHKKRFQRYFLISKKYIVTQKFVHEIGLCLKNEDPSTFLKFIHFMMKYLRSNNKFCKICNFSFFC